MRAGPTKERWQWPSTMPGINVMPAAVDRLRRRLGADLTLSSGDLGNSIPDDQHLARIAVVRFAVPNLHVPEQIGRHRLLPRFGRSLAARRKLTL